jgi:MFS family permease
LRLNGTPLVIVMSCVMILDHLGMGVLPALQPVLIDEWQMTGTEAGWVNGIFAAGYMLGVLVLVPFTDRMDARTIFLWANSIWFLSILGFGLFAEGFVSASILRFIGGFAFAGTYMPGLKLMTDRLGREDASRAIAWYTASFGVGAALSFSLAGFINGALGWQWAFGILGFGALGATILILLTTRYQPPLQQHESRRFLNVRAVLGNRPALAYILSYTLHTTELMTIIAWAVTFLTFAASLQPAGSISIDVTIFGALVSFIAMPASIYGNELARRFGRRQTVSLIMIVSALFGCLAGFSAAMPFWIAVVMLVMYSALSAADSASITAGTVKHAVPELYGATMTVHSFIGFGGGFLGPLAFGFILDNAGGKESIESWGMAFGLIALTSLIGPIILRIMLKDVPQQPSAD